MKKRFLPRLILTLVITIGFIGWMWLNPPATPAPVTEQEGAGTAQIGGTFTLTDNTGKVVTEKALLGKHSLVFFGFTHCPDICPTALLTITNALNQLEDRAAGILPVFITVDPERDTPQVMAEYKKHFHPSLLALTGTLEQTRVAQDAYKVYASKSPPTGGGGEGYTVDHSGYIYLMSPEGQYLAHFAHSISDADLAAALAKHLAVQD